MTTPFTVAQFLDVFVAYNAAIWPAQLGAYAIGLVAVAALWLAQRKAARIIPAILAVMWLWNAVGYQYLFFSRINPAATVFAALFAAEAVLLAMSAISSRALFSPPSRSLKSAIGAFFIAYAYLIYPALGYLAGHGFMAGPMFGVAPCPTVIFTIGLLLMARGRWVIWLSVIPILWSLIGLAAALQLGILEDFGLPIAGLALLLAIKTRPSIA
ncbi:MAG: hypothetical protein BVN32_11230 [Proteobacteria bacterium ST_bin14]|nr:MAG: hypothetical protein BVN32_11230 [Proteobacteria bacterium ST_bin14]